MSEVHAITSAGRPKSEQSRDRIVRYLITMGIRTACFVAALFTEGWLRWTCIAGAGLLPVIAVVLANAGGERRRRPDAYIETVPLAPDHQLDAHEHEERR
ncbi:DUF3099 domain-containing protein [Ruania suaedae]|uniref:DUF3099 domain-containing protein n=1 Tax=Ruania suaedae TaxID=2897774 RepID=UPI001E618A87|nr:DUF3099 domain-containing protein [Ruania suaedae]UFU04319.1 DUF3099 domain-containing protein [Ruania suaedae]